MSMNCHCNYSQQNICVTLETLATQTNNFNLVKKDLLVCFSAGNQSIVAALGNLNQILLRNNFSSLKCCYFNSGQILKYIVFCYVVWFEKWSKFRLSKLLFACFFPRCSSWWSNPLQNVNRAIVKMQCSNLIRGHLLSLVVSTKNILTFWKYYSHKTILL